MDKKNITERKNKIIGFLKKYGAWIIVAILILSVLLGGKKYFETNNRYKQKLDSINQSQIQVEQELEKRIEEKETYITEILNRKEDNYYDELIRERNKRYAAEKKLAAIGSLVFDRKYLDSLKNHIRYD